MSRLAIASVSSAVLALALREFFARRRVWRLDASKVKPVKPVDREVTSEADAASSTSEDPPVSTDGDFYPRVSRGGAAGEPSPSPVAGDALFETCETRPTCAVGRWLDQLRAAEPGSVVKLVLDGTEMSSALDVSLLATLLRRMRTSNARITASVCVGSKSISAIELIVCLSADTVTSAVTPADVAVAWEAPPPALEAIALKLWRDTVGFASKCGRPTSLADLHAAKIVVSTPELEAVTPPPAPPYLLGLRRAGALVIGRLDKTSFNFYWVTKAGSALTAASAMASSCSNTIVLRPATTPTAVASTADANGDVGVRGAPVFSTIDASGTLHLTLDSRVTTTTAAELSAIMRKVSLLAAEAKAVLVTIKVSDGGDDSAVAPRGDRRAVELELFKRCRKWEILLQTLGRRPLAAVLTAPCHSPALHELLFAADARGIGPSVDALGFRGCGSLPGPSAMRGLRRLDHAMGRATVRALVEGTLSRDAAIALRVVTPCCDTTGELALLEEARAAFERRAALTARSELGGEVVAALRAFPAPPPPGPLTMRPVALLTGLSLTLPSKSHEYDQAQMCSLLNLDDGPYAASYKAEHIEKRTLADISKAPDAPGQGVLTLRHLRWARHLLAEAVKRACADAGASTSDVACLVICTSTGYLLPGLTAYVVSDLGLDRGVARFDLVGMGCHAGLNSLKCAASWASAHPGRLAVSAGVEICSAHFIRPGAPPSVDAINDAVVNSLFSDGCFAATLMSPGGENGDSGDRGGAPAHYLALHDFDAVTAVEAVHTMAYHWDERSSQFCFFLDEMAPYVVGAGLAELRERHHATHASGRGLPFDETRHFVLHTGPRRCRDPASEPRRWSPPWTALTGHALSGRWANGHRLSDGGYSSKRVEPRSLCRALTAERSCLHCESARARPRRARADRACAAQVRQLLVHLLPLCLLRVLRRAALADRSRPPGRPDHHGAGRWPRVVPVDRRREARRGGATWPRWRPRRRHAVHPPRGGPAGVRWRFSPRRCENVA